MFIQKSSVCIDKYIYMRALCREVQKEGSLTYVVATISRLLKIIGLFCRILFLL